MKRFTELNETEREILEPTFRLVDELTESGNGNIISKLEESDVRNDVIEYQYELYIHRYDNMYYKIFVYDFGLSNFELFYRIQEDDDESSNLTELINFLKKFKKKFIVDSLTSTNNFELLEKIYPIVNPQKQTYKLI